MAQVDIGKIKIVWKGPWNSGTAYTVDDAVSHGGNSYICIQAGTNQNPSSATAYWQSMAQGADLINISGTAQGDIYYNNGSAIARLAPGTANQVLQTGGSGANPSWTTVSSDCVLLSQNNAQSSVATVTFDNIFTSDYDHYTAHITKYNTGSNGGSLHFRFRGGGSTRNSSLYYGGWNAQNLNSGGTGDQGFRQWGDTYAHIGNGANDVNYPSSTIIDFHRPTEARSSMTIRSTNFDGVNAMRVLVGGYVYMSGTTQDGFEYSDSTGGNMTSSGEVTIYGFKNS